MVLGRLSHHARRTRAKQRLSAALDLAYSRGALLAAVSDDPNVDLDDELSARLSALIPCIRAQESAAKVGLPSHSSAGLVPADVQVLANAARHQFNEPVVGKSPKQARQVQQGSKSRIADTIASDFAMLPPPPPPHPIVPSGAKYCGEIERELVAII